MRILINSEYYSVNKISVNKKLMSDSLSCGRAAISLHKWFIARVLSIPGKVHFRELLTNEMPV